jgi:RHS repeat-associated protein
LKTPITNNGQTVTGYEVAIIQNSDYSPFGAELDGRTTSGTYRLGFQAQEMDDEIKGDGNSVNYKYRMHDPRLGRFFSVDPLASKYPHNGTYNFSENRVMDAVELEGLEAFFIHGTGDGPSMWNKDKDVKSNMESLMGLTNSKTINTNFSWEDKSTFIAKSGTAYLMNTADDRKIAAENLVAYIVANRVEGDEITLIGHSHGANVAIQAASILADKGIKVNIISINAPSYNWGSEDPEGNKGINDMISFWDKSDNVAGGKSILTDNFYGPYSQDYYDKNAQSKTTNVETKSKGDGNASHNSIYFEPKVIEKAIKDKKVEKLKKVKE